MVWQDEVTTDVFLTDQDLPPNCCHVGEEGEEDAE